MAKIKFDHAVIYNGVLYTANTEIEEKEPEKETKSEKETVKKNDSRTGKGAKSRNTAD